MIGPDRAPLISVAYDDLIITNDFTVLPAPHSIQHSSCFGATCTHLRPEENAFITVSNFDKMRGK